MPEEYRPILVFYVLDRKSIELEEPAIRQYAEDNGYDVLIWGGVGPDRLEIISVDNAMVISDIQEWIESTPEILGEELLIIAKEKSYFEGTRERPDLIALDKAGNVVVIELKRDDSGQNTEWQAIKYASYWSNFKANDIIEVFTDYLKKKRKAISESEEIDAGQRILEFIDDEGEDFLAIVD